MKVIIDLIEDIRTSINNDKSFSLVAMGLEENDNGEFTPLWESNICAVKLDNEKKKLFLFLGKEEVVTIAKVLEDINDLENEKMMYEVCVCYSKNNKRFDSSLLGFGEVLKDQKYLVFISE